MTTTKPSVAAAMIAGSILLVACGKDGVTTYDAPRAGDSTEARASATPDARAAASADSAVPPTAGPSAAATPEPSAPDTAGRSAAINPEAPWLVPDGWNVSETRAPMRHATLQIEDEGGPIEVAITRFPGDVGGMLANVNRWRGQVGLPPVGEADLPELLDRFSTPGFEGAALHLRGPNGDMLVASIHETAANRTWFVRVISDPETVDRVKPEVFAFARTFGRTDSDPSP